MDKCAGLSFEEMCYFNKVYGSLFHLKNCPSEARTKLKALEIHSRQNRLLYCTVVFHQSISICIVFIKKLRQSGVDTRYRQWFWTRCPTLTWASSVTIIQNWSINKNQSIPDDSNLWHFLEIGLRRKVYVVTLLVRSEGYSCLLHLVKSVWF